MPFSAASDRLVKALHPYLSELFPVSVLRELGWFDYRNFDHLDSASPAEIAADAFLYMSKDSEGNWNAIEGILVAILGFLNETTGKEASDVQLQALKVLLEQRPMDDALITDWFKQTF